MATDPLRASKLEPRHEGPFKSVRRNRGGSYALMDHDGTLLRRDYTPSQLIPVPKPASPIDTDAIFTVEQVLDHRLQGPGSYEYLVKWRGFDESHNSWEPSSSFFDISSITNYWRTATKPADSALVTEPRQRRLRPDHSSSASPVGEPSNDTVSAVTRQSTRPKTGVPSRYRKQ